MDMRPIVHCVRSFILCGWYLVEARSTQRAHSVTQCIALIPRISQAQALYRLA
jgi:hypothetical protein